LSPQHWAQCAKQTHGKCYTVIDDKQITLFWNGGGNCRRIPLGFTNIAVIMTAPAYKKYQAYLSEAKCDPHKDFVNSQVFLSEYDDLAKRDPHKDFVNSQVFLSEYDDPLATKHQDEQQPKSNKTLKIDFGDEVNAQKHMATQKPLESNQEELLRWHYRLGYVSFNKLKEMALRGDIPRALATCEAPKCAACMYGKLTRRPWRNKREVRSIRPRNIMLTGDCVSIDQFENSTPGFIGLM